MEEQSQVEELQKTVQEQGLKADDVSWFMFCFQFRKQIKSKFLLSYIPETTDHSSKML